MLILGKPYHNEKVPISTHYSSEINSFSNLKKYRQINNNDRFSKHVILKWIITEIAQYITTKEYKHVEFPRMWRKKNRLKYVIEVQT